MAWVEPITWSDGVTYTAAQLNQQFITNVGEMIHVMDTLSEDINIPQADAALGGTLVHTLPIAAGQLMIMTWCAMLGNFEDGAEFVQAVVRVPTGASCSGTMHYINSNGDSTVDQLYYVSTSPADTYTHGAWYIGGLYSNNCVCVDIMVISTTQIGNVELRAHNEDSGSFNVKAGSTVIGFVGATT